MMRNLQTAKLNLCLAKVFSMACRKKKMIFDIDTCVCIFCSFHLRVQLVRMILGFHNTRFRTKWYSQEVCHCDILLQLDILKC